MWGPATFLPRTTGSLSVFSHHSNPSSLGDVSPLQGQVQSQLLHQGRCELGCTCSEPSKLGFFHILSKGTCQMFFLSQLTFREGYLHLILRKDPLENVCVSGGRVSELIWKKAWEMRTEPLSHSTAASKQGPVAQPGGHTAASITPVLLITGDPVLWGC